MKIVAISSIEATTIPNERHRDCVAVMGVADYLLVKTVKPVYSVANGFTDGSRGVGVFVATTIFYRTHSVETATYLETLAGVPLAVRADVKTLEEDRSVI